MLLTDQINIGWFTRYSWKRYINDENIVYFLFKLLKKICFGLNKTNVMICSKRQFCYIHNATNRLQISVIVLEIWAKIIEYLLNIKSSFYFTFLIITNFAQQIQSDKIYHQKAWKISYLMVYLVNLYNSFPGWAYFCRDSTVL